MHMSDERLTALGKFVRKERIERGMLLKEMATGLRLQSSGLSAIETGRKPIPKDFVEKIAAYLDLNSHDRAVLNEAAEKSKKQFRLNDVPVDRRDVAAALARRFNQMSEAEVEKLRDVLNRRKA
jgi:transcriptional regulator with XRE-family HTH domain